ncbi:hypothetical protein VNO77_27069 [Canavalia gladiata]|uniref:Uncharacterized protein n=1 Tax=Canavalia gladiata TaxID=3824 RepID=A0AAN9KU07_CANGL
MCPSSFLTSSSSAVGEFGMRDSLAKGGYDFCVANSDKRGAPNRRETDRPLRKEERTIRSGEPLLVFRNRDEDSLDPIENSPSPSFLKPQKKDPSSF